MIQTSILATNLTKSPKKSQEVDLKFQTPNLGLVAESSREKGETKIELILVLVYSVSWGQKQRRSGEILGTKLAQKPVLEGQEPTPQFGAILGQSNRISR